MGATSASACLTCATGSAGYADGASHCLVDGALVTDWSSPGYDSVSSPHSDNSVQESRLRNQAGYGFVMLWQAGDKVSENATWFRRGLF